MKKGVLYANGVVASLSQTLLSKEFYIRLNEIKTKTDFLSVFEETQFNSYQDDKPFNELMDLEIEKLISFVKKESPDDIFTKFFLLPFDYENILAFCKCSLLNLDARKYISLEGTYTFEQIKTFISNKKYADFNNEFIKKALILFDKLSEMESIEGWEIDCIFRKSLYENLMKISIKNSLIYNLVKELVTVENLSVAMRGGSQFEVESQFIPLGKLDKTQILRIFRKDNSVLSEIKDRVLIDFVILALSDEIKKSSIEFERNKQSLCTNFFFNNKDKIETIAPFGYFIFRKFTDIKNVRLAYSFVENGLSNEIKKRILNCEK